jgi:TPR repeat protein
MYQLGEGVEIDLERGFEIIKKSAVDDNPTGLNNLGWAYLQGLGTKEDLNLAFKYFTKSSNLGYEVAQVNLANCYQQGWGTKVDLFEAYKWFSIATRLGFDAKKSVITLSSKLTSEQILAAENFVESWLKSRVTG